MQLKIRLMLLLSVVCAAVSAQNDRVSFLDIGDVAPRFKTTAWIKGDTVQKFVKNHTYVLEYWATWCKPCKAAMPHLSVLARQYRDRVTVLGINSFEEAHTTKQTVHAFVDSMGT
ncbi:MAG: redoxin domain-containing protein, partial [Chitinophagaceae bacterium]